MTSVDSSLAQRRRFQSGPTRVGSACKRIVRYVRAHGLQSGDRLPSQDQLRRLMGFSNDTLLAAMGMLVARGGLRRQSGRGTEICDLEALYGINWTVGLAGLVAPDSGPGAFYGALLHRLLSRLSRANCRCNTYFRDTRVQAPCRLADFPGLEGDIEDGAIDGLIVLTLFDERACRAAEKRGISISHVGFWDSMPHATVVDRVGMVVEAADILTARGARRLALIDWNPDFLMDGIRKRLSGRFAPASTPLAACESIRVGSAVGQSLAAIVRHLCARPPGRRPDALVFTEDYTAQETIEALARQTAYRPLIAVSTNKQLPLAFSLPVIKADLDLDELADRAIANCRKRLLDPAADGAVEYVLPRVCG